MMISPEGFYDEYLKGKTAEEILKVIRSLKREISRLKNIVENPTYTCKMCPSEETKIWCNYLYLERAKKALAELGVEYQPTKSELKAMEFDANIPYIYDVVLTIGGYFYGNDEYDAVIMDDEVLYSVSHFNFGNPPQYTRAIDADMTKEEFLEELKNLHIGEWRKNYDTQRFGYDVCDGTQWTLEIKYAKGKKPVKIYGDNAYPYNFNRLKALMMCEFED